MTQQPTLVEIKQNVKRARIETQQALVSLKLSLPDLEVSKSSAHIPSLAVFCKFDDPWSHARGLTRSLCQSQVRMVTRDLIVNEQARSAGKTLLRFWSDVGDLSACSSLDDLIDKSYHAVVNGSVVKEGSFFLRDRTNLFDRQQILEFNEREFFSNAPGRDYTRRVVLPLVADFIEAHAQYHGWFYPECDQSQLEGILKALETTEMINSGVVTMSNVGSSWLKSFSRSFWSVANGPRASTTVRKKLIGVVKYRLGLNDSIDYDYTLADGRPIKTRETFDINFKTIRTGFVVQRHGVSWFRPAAAATIYKHLLGEKQNPVVWDPSIGFSARLLGFAGAYPGGTYVGSDPAKLMVDDAHQLAKLLGDRIDVELHQVGSEKINFTDDRKFDLVFTSPPYFDTEKYVDETGQCWRDNPDLDSWVFNYLKPTMEIAHRSLKFNGKMAFNVPQSLADLFVACATHVGFKRAPHLNLVFSLRNDHFHRKLGKTADPEIIVCFKK